MGNKTIGGGNKTELYPIGVTGATWTPGTLIIGLDKNFTTAIAGHEKSKNLEATITHEIFDETYTGLLANYLSESADTTAENYEDGSSNETITEISAGVTNVLLAITYSGKSNEAIPRRYVKAFPCVLQGGGYTMESEKSIRPETKLVAVKALYNIAVPTLNTNLVTGAGTTTATITANTYGNSFWLTAV
jgi:hypothetical protein